MVKEIRVDYRLLHGQVAVTWISALNVDCLLLVSDTIQDDKLRLNALKLAKPSGIKVVIKNTNEAVEALLGNVTEKYKLFVICETLKIARKIVEVSGEKSLNIGNTPFREDAKRYGKSAFLTMEEENEVREMLDMDIDVYAQMVPADKAVKLKMVIKSEGGEEV